MSAALASQIHLYHLTLQPPSAITCSVQGSFSAPRVPEIVVARSRVLELLRPDENGRVHSVTHVDVFGNIRSMQAFKLAGQPTDFIAIASDSGRFTVVHYNAEKARFEEVHQETYGKTGCRRIVPGQYVAADAKGRAIMVSAVEKSKIVYIMNRDQLGNLTISSPLEANKSNAVVHDVIGLDVGYENPVFVALEVDHGEVDEDHTGESVAEVTKNLTYYELDLGLNNVIRKQSEPVDRTANLLITVPGGKDGPGGVLVCSENWISYRNSEGHPASDVRCPIPRRVDMRFDRSVLLVASSKQRLKDSTLFFLQSEYGDLYKVWLEVANGVVTGIQCRYFDTVPTSVSINVLRTGLLFAAAEMSDPKVYMFQSIGSPEVEEGDIVTYMELDDPVTAKTYRVPCFRPRTLTNLVQVDQLDSLCPATDVSVADVYNEDAPQMVVACGRGPQSSLRIVRHGMSVQDLAVTDLPSKPVALWTMRKRVGDEFDAYIVISFANATLVLSIGETVEEVTDTGFLATAPTIACGPVGDDALVQVHPQGLRHVRADKRINEWKTPDRKPVVAASINARQVVLALQGGELVYFELDPGSGSLVEVGKYTDLTHEVTAVSMAPLLEGHIRTRFLAVGTAEDRMLRVLSLNPDDQFQVLSRQALQAEAQSLQIVNFGLECGGQSALQLHLVCGLKSGVMVRSVLDSVTGGLSDSRSRFMGTKPVSLFPTKVEGKTGLVALSSRSWLLYAGRGRLECTPLADLEPFEHATGFCSEQCSDGIAGVTGSSMRIVTVPRLGQTFHHTHVPLSHTPRRMAVFEGRLYIVEADHQMYTAKGTKDLYEELNSALEEAEVETRVEPLPAREYGSPIAPEGQWASVIRCLNLKGKTEHVIELDPNEAAVSLCVCRFHDYPGELFLVVGTGRDMKVAPRSCSSGFIHVYNLVEDGNRAELVHTTEVDDVPYALCSFQGQLLVGVGSVLRLYDMGKKKLLKKTENRSVPNFITSIQSEADRIYVSDVSDSFFYFKYRKTENSTYLYAEDIAPRWVTASCLVDGDTIAAGDKFGNVFLVRLPQDVSREVDTIDPSGDSWFYDQPSYLMGAPNRLDEVVQFHVGEVVTSIKRVKLQRGGVEGLLYTTILGAVGILVPLGTREDVDFLSNLEMHLRQENPPLCGRSHVSWRSCYFPVRCCVDGDLCEQFYSLDYSQQRQIAEDLDRSPQDITKKLEMIRSSAL